MFQVRKLAVALVSALSEVDADSVWAAMRNVSPTSLPFFGRFALPCDSAASAMLRKAWAACPLKLNVHERSLGYNMRCESDELSPVVLDLGIDLNLLLSQRHSFETNRRSSESKPVDTGLECVFKQIERAQETAGANSLFTQRMILEQSLGH